LEFELLPSDIIVPRNEQDQQKQQQQQQLQKQPFSIFSVQYESINRCFECGQPYSAFSEFWNMPFSKSIDLLGKVTELNKPYEFHGILPIALYVFYSITITITRIGTQQTIVQQQAEITKINEITTQPVQNHKQNQTPSSKLTLDIDTFSIVLSFCNMAQVCKLQQICKQWFTMIRIDGDATIWKAFYLYYFTEQRDTVSFKQDFKLPKNQNQNNNNHHANIEYQKKNSTKELANFKQYQQEQIVSKISNYYQACMDIIHQVPILVDITKLPYMMEHSLTNYMCNKVRVFKIPYKLKQENDLLVQKFEQEQQAQTKQQSKNEQLKNSSKANEATEAQEEDNNEDDDDDFKEDGIQRPLRAKMTKEMAQIALMISRVTENLYFENPITDLDVKVSYGDNSIEAPYLTKLSHLIAQLIHMQPYKYEKGYYKYQYTRYLGHEISPNVQGRFTPFLKLDELTHHSRERMQTGWNWYGSVARYIKGAPWYKKGSCTQQYILQQYRKDEGKEYNASTHTATGTQNDINEYAQYNDYSLLSESYFNAGGAYCVITEFHIFQVQDYIIVEKQLGSEFIH